MRWSQWVALYCGCLIMLSTACVKAKQKATESDKKAIAFALPGADGGAVSVGKPWKGWTVLVFFRGDW